MKTASSDFHLFMGFKALPISLMDNDLHFNK